MNALGSDNQSKLSTLVEEERKTEVSCEVLLKIFNSEIRPDQYKGEPLYLYTRKVTNWIGKNSVKSLCSTWATKFLHDSCLTVHLHTLRPL